MMRPLLAVAMLAVVAVVSVSCGGSDTVRMGTEGAYPPFNFINDDGEIDGLERELGDELCRRADLECEWVTNEWDSMIPNLLDGKYDTILAGMSITDERAEVIDFTQPYVPPVPSVYMALAEAGGEAVSGRVAAQAATVQADFLADSGAALVEFALAPEVVEAVLSGDADAALVDRAFAREAIAESGGKADTRRSGGPAGRRNRRRRQGGRHRLEGQAEPRHRCDEGGRLVERAYQGVAGVRRGGLLRRSPPMAERLRVDAPARPSLNLPQRGRGLWCPPTKTLA